MEILTSANIKNIIANEYALYNLEPDIKMLLIVIIVWKRPLDTKKNVRSRAKST
jgi:hypothetical protein